VPQPQTQQGRFYINTPPEPQYPQPFSVQLGPHTLLSKLP
jgi:hypothetical protein